MRVWDGGEDKDVRKTVGVRDKGGILATSSPGYCS